MADSVEKISSSTLRNFLRLVGADFRERRGGPHRPLPSQPKTRLIDLRQQTNQIEDLISIQVNFLQRSTFDFFNRIGPERTCVRFAGTSGLDVRSALWAAFDPLRTPRFSRLDISLAERSGLTVEREHWSAFDPQLTSMLPVKTACYAVFTFHQSPCSPAGHVREVGTDKGFEAFCGGRQFGVPNPQHRDNVPHVPPRKAKRGQGFGS